MKKILCVLLLAGLNAHANPSGPGDVGSAGQDQSHFFADKDKAVDKLPFEWSGDIVGTVSLVVPGAKDGRPEFVYLTSDNKILRIVDPKRRFSIGMGEKTAELYTRSQDSSLKIDKKIKSWNFESYKSTRAALLMYSDEGVLFALRTSTPNCPTNVSFAMRPGEKFIFAKKYCGPKYVEMGNYYRQDTEVFNIVGQAQVPSTLAQILYHQEQDLLAISDNGFGMSYNGHQVQLYKVQLSSNGQLTYLGRLGEFVVDGAWNWPLTAYLSTLLTKDVFSKASTACPLMVGLSVGREDLSGFSSDPYQAGFTLTLNDSGVCEANHMSSNFSGVSGRSYIRVDDDKVRYSYVK